MIEAIAFCGALFFFLANTWLTHRERREERQQWAEERSELLNRIKPETAQAAKHPAAPLVEEDYWEKLEGPFAPDTGESPWAEIEG